MIDLFILLIIIGYCIFVIVQQYKKKKANASGCNGICAGCSGCNDLSNLKDIYFANKAQEKENR